MAMAETLARASAFRIPASASNSSIRRNGVWLVSASNWTGTRVGRVQTLVCSRRNSSWKVYAAGDGVEVGVKAEEEEGTFLPSGEWPENFSILNFEDLCAHYEPVIFKAEAQPSAYLADVMSKLIYTVRAENLLEEVDHFFAEISGLPVIDKDLKCVGVLSRKDKTRAPNGLKSKVGDVMTTPALTLSADKTVQDAAILMLKNKIHRIPVVNDANQVVGIVTRTDIFTALGGGSS
eukprot:TRINITY_DN21198_c0_g1_i1.p1 TRINITY_DN21198_c0_g1~~TRINITY_DN21198_c0_g1_i1.p1  ORF type:complete len:235 (-),score=20.34 TRINITY_DN21198_c0_g1_i1:581-1285(-)